VDYEGLPTDWYLRLTGAASRMIRYLKPFPRISIREQTERQAGKLA
jgi:hypothetical protein